MRVIAKNCEVTGSIMDDPASRIPAQLVSALAGFILSAIWNREREREGEMWMDLADWMDSCRICTWCRVTDTL